jgi:hypothetical protein
MKYTICRTEPNGDYSYYLRGLRHRVDGYAQKEGNNLYSYRFGELHSFNDEPAVVCGDVKKWYDRGRPHRNNEMNGRPMPAVVSTDTYEWYQNGLLHNSGVYPSGVPRPARVKKNPDGCIEYRSNGKLHCSYVFNGQVGAALISNHINADGNAIIKSEWALHGKYHRTDRGMLKSPCDIGCVGVDNMQLPAVTHTGKSYCYAKWAVDDMLHREDRGSGVWNFNGDQFLSTLPAVITIDEVKAFIKYEWRQNGFPYRDEMGLLHPSITTPIRFPHECVKRDNLIIYKWFNEKGEAHSGQYGTYNGQPNTLLPAVIGIMNGSVCFTLWYLNGKLHRDNLPAVIINSTHRLEVWVTNDKVHRNDAPAVVGSDGTEIWALDGLIHRNLACIDLVGVPALRLKGEWSVLRIPLPTHGSNGSNITIKIDAEFLETGITRRLESKPMYIKHKPVYGWFKMGNLHRTSRGLLKGVETQLPALILRNNTMIWCKDGEFHREPDNGMRMPTRVLGRQS